MKQNINEIKRMQLIAGLITESEYRESLTNEDLESDLRGDLEKVSGQGPILDPVKLTELIRALKTHGGFIGDKQSYKEIANLLASNQLAKATNVIVNLDTSPKEFVYEMMEETYPELWNMLFSGDESGYIAADRPKRGLPEDLESDIRGDLEKVSGMKSGGGIDKAKVLKALFSNDERRVTRNQLDKILRQLDFQSAKEFENAWKNVGLELDIDKPGEGYTVWEDNYAGQGDYIEFVNGWKKSGSY